MLSSLKSNLNWMKVSSEDLQIHFILQKSYIFNYGKFCSHATWLCKIEVNPASYITSILSILIIDKKIVNFYENIFTEKNPQKKLNTGLGLFSFIISDEPAVKPDKIQAKPKSNETNCSWQ